VIRFSPHNNGNKKNHITNQAFQEPEVVEMASFEGCLTTGFAKNKKEEAFCRTNMSSINMLRSFRTLDFEDKDQEYDLIGGTMASVAIAQKINRNSQLLADPTHGRQVEVVPEYQSYRERPEVVRNTGNKHVSSGRVRHYSSTFLKEM
jgi:hypothetical protein